MKLLNQRREKTKSKNYPYSLVVLLFSVLSIVAPFAVKANGVVLENTQELHVKSAASKRDYRIWVSEPQGEVPAEGYSVIYVLDSPQMFPILSAANTAYARSIRETAALVVGIGYPKDANVMQERTWDLTPFADETGRMKTGGAKDFLGFIKDDLKPLIEKTYNVNKTKQALYGHSFGGLFTLYTFFTSPESFQKYAMISPSIWFGNKKVLGFQSNLLSKDLSGFRAFVAVGEFEEKLSPKAQKFNNAKELSRRLKVFSQVSNATALAQGLEKLLPVEFQIIPGANHTLAGRASAVNALPFLYAD